MCVVQVMVVVVMRARACVCVCVTPKHEFHGSGQYNVAL